jgi:type I restriction enzyme, S subunit
MTVSDEWRDKSLRDLAVINYGRSPSAILSEDGAYPVFGTAGPERHGTAYLYDGDSVILGRKGTIDRVYYATGKFWTIDTAYYLSNFRGALPRWLFYFLQTLDLASLNEATGVPSLSRDTLYSLRVRTPPPSEQAKITEILSAADHAITATETLIAKQQRIKTGLIHDLLWRGIDANGNLRSERTHDFKDSPAGRIPLEWEAKPLSTVVDLQVGYAFKSTWFIDEGVRLLRGDNVGTGSPLWKNTRCLPDAIAARFAEYVLGDGDVVIGMDRTFTKQGFKVSVLGRDDVPCLLVQRVGRFVPVNVPHAYMKMLVQSPNYQRQLFLQQKGMDIPHLSKTEILSPQVPVPSRPEEMDAIAKHLAAMLGFEDHLVSHRRKLDSLKAGLMQGLLSGDRRVTPLLALNGQTLAPVY